MVEQASTPGEEPTTGLRRRDRNVRVAAGIGGVAGIVLLVLGFLGFSAASDDDDSTRVTRREEATLLDAERAARVERDALLEEARQLDEDVRRMADTSLDLGEAENAVSEALDAAVGLANDGRISESRAAYEAQAGAIADLEAKLATAQQALAAAHFQLAAVEQEAAS